MDLYEQVPEPDERDRVVFELETLLEEIADRHRARGKAMKELARAVELNGDDARALRDATDIDRALREAFRLLHALHERAARSERSWASAHRAALELYRLERAR